MKKIIISISIIYYIFLLLFLALHSNWFRYGFALEEVLIFVIILIPLTLGLTILSVKAVSGSNLLLQKNSLIFGLVACIFLVLIHINVNPHSMPLFYLNVVDSSPRQVLKTNGENIEYSVKLFNAGSSSQTAYLNIVIDNLNKTIPLKPPGHVSFDSTNYKVPVVLYGTLEKDVYILELVSILTMDYFKINLHQGIANYITSINISSGGYSYLYLPEKIYLNSSRDTYIALGLKNELKDTHEVVQSYSLLYVNNKNNFSIPIAIESNLIIMSNIADFANWGKLVSADNDIVIIETFSRVGNYKIKINLKDKSTTSI